MPLCRSSIRERRATQAGRASWVGDPLPTCPFLFTGTTWKQQPKFQWCVVSQLRNEQAPAKEDARAPLPLHAARAKAAAMARKGRVGAESTSRSGEKGEFPKGCRHKRPHTLHHTPLLWSS